MHGLVPWLEILLSAAAENILDANRVGWTLLAPAFGDVNL